MVQKMETKSNKGMSVLRGCPLLAFLEAMKPDTPAYCLGDMCMWWVRGSHGGDCAIVVVSHALCELAGLTKEQKQKK